MTDNEDRYYERLQEMAELYPQYLLCRGGQHLMDLVDNWRVVDTKVEAQARPHMGHDVYAKRIYECSRCGKKRNDFYEISSHRGHVLLKRINATYDDPPGFAILGLGRMPNARGLVMGMTLEAVLNTAQVRGRGRPRKGDTR